MRLYEGESMVNVQRFGCTNAWMINSIQGRIKKLIAKETHRYKELTSTIYSVQS